MIWLISAIGVIVVVLIALVAVGASVGRQRHETQPTPYSLPDAVQHASDHLPQEVAGRVRHDDVRTVLKWHLDWFAEAGLATDDGTLLGDPAVEDGNVVVADADAAIDAVVARSLDAHGPEPVDVACILDAHCDYLLQIGALTADTGDGPAAPTAAADTDD